MTAGSTAKTTGRNGGYVKEPNMSKQNANATREQLEAEERAWEHTETDRSPWGEFTIATLRAAFDAVAPKGNWKDSIHATVRVADLSVTCAAIAFFTGSKPVICNSMHAGWVNVTAAGYYAACGA